MKDKTDELCSFIANLSGAEFFSTVPALGLATKLSDCVIFQKLLVRHIRDHTAENGISNRSS